MMILCMRPQIRGICNSTDGGVNAVVKSQVQVHDASSSGGLKSQNGNGGAELGTELAEPSNSKMASSTKQIQLKMKQKKG
ncbi:hypothetical protein L1987_78104 [Smallanthus sonchifolius]|uniref:Uncharacterized protein n=1 Tax=Smallanthus sonchifolius TaxID=185202 RepID=A0ACB8ZC89_9ASTR|nr:hypothetical protein L1987_78104 [Smallanthus sonchifolius]